MDAYLLLAPVLLLPVLFLWRLAGCLLDRSGLGNATARTRPALGACAANEHIVEFVVIFPILATESKEDYFCTFSMTPTTEDDFRYYGSRPTVEDVENDRTWTRDNPDRERFIFFGCVEELSEGQFRVNCQVSRRGVTAIEGTCTGGPPTVADTRIQFVASSGDTELTNTHCFDTP